MSSEAALPFLTADIPAAGGALKVDPLDFEVEELPAYPPNGEGEHLFLWIEKVGRDTQEVARELARAAGATVRDVSYAGLKDRHALTRQFFCLPARFEAALAQFEAPGVRVLSARRHRNKLRTGHLDGNRFRIRLRDVRDLGAAHATLEQLRQQGMPNFFGEQRFGRRGDNALHGKRLLLGERLEHRIDRFERKLYLSAFQSLLFNRALARRISERTFGAALLGDVLRKSDSGGLFLCEDPLIDQPRMDRFEVSAAGPLFGPQMLPSGGAVELAERELLREESLELADFARGGDETAGARRPFRISLTGLTAEPLGSDLLLSFELPRGAYATIVLRELLKQG